MSSIEIEIHTPTSCIVTLHGEHDLASSEQMTLALVLARNYTSVLVDLTACTFLDVTITTALLTAAQCLRQDDHSLELIVPRDARSVRRVLDLAGVLSIIPLHATRAAGLAATASAELLGAHRRGPDLRAVTARIDELASMTEASRAQRVAKTARGTTVLRALVAEPEQAGTEARRRAA